MQATVHNIPSITSLYGGNRFVDQNRIASRRPRMVTLIRYNWKLGRTFEPCQAALT
jgi:hypothetical protein